MTVSERLKIFLAQKDITKYRLAVDTGIPHSTVSRIFSREKGLQIDNLEKILLAYPELNGDWLLTGRGEMLLPTPTNIIAEITAASDSE